MKKPLLLAILTLLMGCASTSGSFLLPVSHAEESLSPEIKATLVYQILGAELALQDGNFPLALAHYTQAIKHTQHPDVLARTTRIALINKNHQQAYQLAKQWTEADPNSRDASQITAILAFRTDDLEAAHQHFLHFIELTNKPHQGFMVVAKLLLSEEPTKAINLMQSLVNDYPNHAKAWYTLGHLAYKHKQLKIAQDALKKTLSLHPYEPTTTILLAHILNVQQQQDEATRLLQDALTHKKDIRIQEAYARLLVASRDLNGAREQFSELLSQDPDNTELLFSLSLLLLDNNQLDKAEVTLKKLLILDRHQTKAHYFLGRIDEENNRPAVALEHYRAINEGEHYLDARIRATQLLAKLQDLQTARDFLHLTITSDVEQQIRLYQLDAELLIDHDQLQQAMAIYNRALKRFDKHIDLLYGRAMLAERLDQLNILEQDLKQIIALDADNSDAYNSLGFTLANRTERYDEALHYIEQALKIKPDSYYILDSMGWIQYRLGNHQKAIEYLQRAYNIEHDPEVAAHLGELLWVSGKKSESKLLLHKALESSPDNVILQRTIKKLHP